MPEYKQSDPVCGGVHGSRRLSRRHRPDPKSWEHNPKEMRYYESLDKIYPNIL